jgi:hypothetical protein
VSLSTAARQNAASNLTRLRRADPRATIITECNSGTAVTDRNRFSVGPRRTLPPISRKSRRVAPTIRDVKIWVFGIVLRTDLGVRLWWARSRVD